MTNHVVDLWPSLHGEVADWNASNPLHHIRLGDVVLQVPAGRQDIRSNHVISQDHLEPQP